MSSTRNCNCKDSTIVEGIFDEISSARREAESEEDFFRRIEGDAEIVPRIVKSYTLTNSNRMEVVLIEWGATIVSIKCPDKYGRPEDVVLGFDELESYANPRTNRYFGCVLGRCANRIREGCFRIGGKEYQVTLNENHKHHLHGGINGFSRQVWDSCIDGCTVVMSHMSEDGWEGYPGAVLATVRFKLTPDNRLEIGMRATATKSTVVNLSHGSLFNLAGHDAGREELMKHRICLNCDRWTFTDPGDPVPTGAIRGVGGTVMDLRVPRLLADTLKKIPMGQGFDHNFCVTRTGASQAGGHFVARALHAESGRILEVYSNQPGVQFYTGSQLPSGPVDDANPEDSMVSQDARILFVTLTFASFSSDENHFLFHCPNFISPITRTKMKKNFHSDGANVKMIQMANHNADPPTSPNRIFSRLPGARRRWYGPGRFHERRKFRRDRRCCAILERGYSRREDRRGFVAIHFRQRRRQVPEIRRFQYSASKLSERRKLPALSLFNSPSRPDVLSRSDVQIWHPARQLHVKRRTHFSEKDKK